MAGDRPFPTSVASAARAAQAHGVGAPARRRLGLVTMVPSPSGRAGRLPLSFRVRSVEICAGPEILCSERGEISIPAGAEHYRMHSTSPVPDHLTRAARARGDRVAGFARRPVGSTRHRPHRSHCSPDVQSTGLASMEARASQQRESKDKESSARQLTYAIRLFLYPFCYVLHCRT